MLACSPAMTGDPFGPLAYLITFRCYGTWLHGDPRGSIDRQHNQYGARLLPSDLRRMWRVQERLHEDPIELTAERRCIVEDTIRQVCLHRGWMLHALNVRTNHVHSVISASAKPEQVLRDLKAWSTRRMIESGALQAGAKPWSRHGSTVYLWTLESLAQTCRYVMEGQDEAAA